jgi:hypothetical protein
MPNPFFDPVDQLLLGDIYMIFQASGATCIFSNVLLAALQAILNRPYTSIPPALDALDARGTKGEDIASPPLRSDLSRRSAFTEADGRGTKGEGFSVPPQYSSNGEHSKFSGAWLARRLKVFGIHSQNITINGSRAKGYKRADFADIFARIEKNAPTPNS